jgi:hypothetical protein
MEVEEDKDAEWWTDVSKKFDFNRIEYGGKVILLLQFLAHAELIGECLISPYTMHPIIEIADS